MSNPYEKYVQSDNPYTQYASDAGAALAQGFQRGGPIGAVVGGAGKGMDNLGDWLSKVGYNVGGATTDLAAKYLPAETAGGLGFAANVATQAIPTIFGGQAAKSAAPLLKKGARQLMQSSLKPTTEALRTGKAARAIDTMFKEGVNATPGGVEKLRARISELSDEIDVAIKNSPASVDKNAVASRLKDLIKKFEMQANPWSDVKAIENAWTEFLAHPMISGSKIPVQTAQEMKKGTYKVLGDKAYGEQKGAAAEAQKALARGLKEEISTAVPEVSGLNKYESDLINAMKVLERRVLQDANKNPLGLGALNPFTLPVWLWDRSPFLKSLTARGLYGGAEQIPANAARLGVGAFMSDTGSQE